MADPWRLLARAREQTRARTRRGMTDGTEVTGEEIAAWREEQRAAGGKWGWKAAAKYFELELDDVYRLCGKTPPKRGGTKTRKSAGSAPPAQAAQPPAPAPKRRPGRPKKDRWGTATGTAPDADAPVMLQVDAEAGEVEQARQALRQAEQMVVVAGVSGAMGPSATWRKIADGLRRELFSLAGTSEDPMWSLPREERLARWARIVQRLPLPMLEIVEAELERRRGRLLEAEEVESA